MKYLNKTNLSDINYSIGLCNVLKNIRRREFSFESINKNCFKTALNNIIDRIQNFYLLIFQNQKV